MFSPSMPFTSLRPIPPTPMHATLSLSLGGLSPRPSTWRGTIVNATPAPSSRTKFRRVMRFLVMARASTSRAGAGRDGLARALRTKQRREQHEDDERKSGGQHPEAGPAIEGEAGRAAEETGVHVARYLRADEHADAVGHEHEESLRLAPHRGRRFLVDVDLPGHEEKVVADAVQQDPDGDEPEDRVRSRQREQSIPQRPRSHADHQHALHAESYEEKRHEQHEDDLGHLTE